MPDPHFHHVAVFRCGESNRVKASLSAACHATHFPGESKDNVVSEW